MFHLLLFFCRLLPIATAFLLPSQTGGSKAGTFLSPGYTLPEHSMGGGRSTRNDFLFDFIFPGHPPDAGAPVVAGFHGAGCLKAVSDCW